MLSIVKTICLYGLEGSIINVEVDVSSGMPCWDIVGLPDMSLKESKERVRTAIKNCNIELLSKKYIINLSPANIRKAGASIDLAIAIGVLLSIGRIKKTNLEETAFIGELSLDGKLNHVKGILPICLEAKKLGIKRIVIPKSSIKEASVVSNIKIIGASNLKEVIEYLNGNIEIENPKIKEEYTDVEYNIDFSEVRGQKFTKRALEIGVAGGHNCLLIGSPGSR